MEQNISLYTDMHIPLYNKDNARYAAVLEGMGLWRKRRANRGSWRI
jgi:hypothetical protein